MLRIAFISSIVFAAACSSSNGPTPPEEFDTFQLCYDEHHMTEMLSPACAIEICCIDHPIGSGQTKGNIVCGASTATCKTYVTTTANLMDSTDTMLTTDINTACTNYAVDGMHGGSGSGGMCGS
jgi:hypothetical protein